MIIGIPREIMHDENRVAAIPETVQEMVASGYQVHVETGAGKGSHISDEQYQAEKRQYELGLATSTDVLEAQTSLADAQRVEILALTEYQVPFSVYTEMPPSVAKMTSPYRPLIASFTPADAIPE